MLKNQTRLGEFRSDWLTQVPSHTYMYYRNAGAVESSFGNYISIITMKYFETINETYLLFVS